jgi:hypothetical protein
VSAPPRVLGLGAESEGHRVMIALSIDFDWFIRDLPEWDFGHSERGMIARMQDVLWHSRYASFDLHAETDPARYADVHPLQFITALEARGMDLNHIERLVVADSHRHAAEWADGQIVSIDAHHDLYKEVEDTVECDNWLVAAIDNGAQATVVYPKWKPIADDPVPVRPAQQIQWADWHPEPVRVAQVFVCRSSSWVPPHHDALFEAFVNQWAERAERVEVIAGLTRRTAPSVEVAAALRLERAQMWKQLEERHHG